MPTQTTSIHRTTTPHQASRGLTNWRCRSCGALLGRYLDHRMQISFARGHEYYVTLPVTTRCRTCRSLNELTPRPRD